MIFFVGDGFIPVTDPVEVNYARTAKEMLEANDWLSPRIYGHYWYDKPIFFYWELMAAFSLFGVSDFAARFFPGVFAVFGLALTYFFARRMFGGRVALWSAVILGTSLIYWCLAKLIITDMTLFVFMNGALVFFYLGYREKRPNFYYAAYALSALAVLTKGPVGLCLPGLIILLFLIQQRDLRHLREMRLIGGFGVFLAVCAPWYAGMYQAHGQDFIEKFLGVHNYLRATVSEHPKWNVWYYYTGIYFLATLPWCFALPWALRERWQKWREKGFGAAVSFERDTVFLLIWALTINVFFQCMATKYPTYTFPSLLPVAILTARFLLARFRTEFWLKSLAIGGALLAVIATAVVVWRSDSDGHFAGGRVAAELKQRLKDDDLLLIFGDWRASIVYYTDHPMYSLDSASAILRRKPQGMDWSSKNVMPMMAIEDVPFDRDIYLVVEEHRFPEFDIYPRKDEWQLIMVANPGDEVLRLYYRPASK